MRNVNRFQIIIGCIFMLIGIFAFVDSVGRQINYGFPVGKMIIVLRGETKYIGSFYFRYNKEGWVSVNYRLTVSIWGEGTESTLSQIIFPAKVGSFFDVDSNGIKFGFKVIDIGETYVVLQRYW